MPMRVDMGEFLRSGQFGPIVWGLPMHQVEALLGAPRDIGEGMTNLVWMYGSLELLEYHGFLEGVLLYYPSEYKSSFTLPPGMELTGPPLSEHTTPGELTAFLERERLAFTATDIEEIGLRITIGASPTAVEAWFYGPDGGLYLISFFRERDDDPG